MVLRWRIGSRSRRSLRSYWRTPQKRANSSESHQIRESPPRLQDQGEGESPQVGEEEPVGADEVEGRLIRGNRTGEENRRRVFRIREKENLGALEKRSPSEPTRWREGKEEAVAGAATVRRSQVTERESKTNDWLWKEEVLWMQKRKSHGDDEDGDATKTVAAEEGR